MRWIRMIRNERGQVTAEYVGVLLLVAAVVAALFGARYHEQVGAAARAALCRLVTAGPCEQPAVAGDDAGGSGADSGAGAPGAAGPGEQAGGPADATVRAGGRGGFLQTSRIAGGPLAVLPVQGPVDPNDLDPDEDSADDSGFDPFNPQDYARRHETFQGQEFGVRGYLNPVCLRTPFPCTSKWRGTFRPEYTAQAHAIRALSNLKGRRSFYERWIKRDPVDNNVHWEVGPDGNPWRIDILAHDDDGDSILEVKRYRGPQTTSTVDDQLERYRQNMLAQGVRVTRNNELNTARWAVTYTQPPSLKEQLLGQPGRRWYAWADPRFPGHVYFAPEDETPEDVKERAEDEDPGWMDEVREGGLPIPLPIPIRPPVPVPVVV